MNKPTREEYETALKDKAAFTDWIERESELMDEYLDKLLDVRENIRLYKERLVKANDVILKYKLYKEIEEELKHDERK